MSKIREGRTLPIILKVPQAKAGVPPPVGKVRPVLSVVPSECNGLDESGTTGWFAGSIAMSESVIDEIVREGARRMLAEALRAEVASYLEGSLN
jgi:hypothetical protein